ncbi:hypothetical protein LWI28_020776 [Acer negundo]|uniref:Leucine--tRNA ligase RagD-binding domain-containing protein n=1 Tax=Acer negundo TaxID=4023 RepID=A0AAD5I7H4_ACENE|nr:hypothetical protein LWI28_020776 [Acer negundo]
MRKLLQKQILGSKKGNKGTPVTTLTEDKLKGLVYVNEEFEGWKAECLKILQSKFDSKTCTFAPDREISEALQKSTVGQAANFKQTQKLCMPFLRFKKDEAIAIGPQAWDLRLPFGEIDVLQENLDLIRRQLGLEEVEILSVADHDALAKAGLLASLLKQNPPSPGNPTAIFVTKIGINVEENQQRRIKNNILAFAKRYFSPEKVKILSAISDPDLQRQEFIKLWTLKVSKVPQITKVT